VDPKWLSREVVHREIDAIDINALSYSDKLYAYCLHGEPYTGFCKWRYPGGELESVVHFDCGIESGVSVVWYPAGQIQRYAETNNGVLHGECIEWDESGSYRLIARYIRGRRVEVVDLSSRDG
jgi:hypothetical protein